MIKGLVEIFEKKYPKKVEDLPLVKNKDGQYYNPSSEIFSDLKGIRLLDFGFTKENYLVFHDSIKTVLIGFSNSELKRNLSDRDKEIAFYNPGPQISEKGATRSFDKLREYMKTTSKYQMALSGTRFEEPLLKKEGYELEINYLFNSDFEELIQKIKINDKRIQRRIQIKDSLADGKNNTLNQNIDQL